MYKLETSHWHILRVTHLLGGLFSIVGIILGITITPIWFALSIVVGLMQIIFALSGYCPSAIFFAWMGIARTEQSNKIPHNS